MNRLGTGIPVRVHRNNSAYVPLIVAMCASFHTSAVVGGFNVSLSDAFLVLFFAVLLLDRRLEVPRGPSIFVLLLVAATVFMSLWFIPQMQGVDPDFTQTLGGLIKLAISFLFFVAGWTVARLGRVGIAVRSFAFGGVLAALLGILTLAVPLPALDASLYYDSFRYRGLMSDPNFFALLACAAFVVIASDPRPLRLKGAVSLSALALAVLMSGSKAGLLTLLFSLLIALLTRLSPRTRPVMLAYGALLTATILILAEPLLAALEDLLDWLGNYIPQVGRLSVLLTANIVEGLSVGGSVRDEVWGTALEMLRQSPLFGVGVGNYLNVSSNVHDLDMVAHNTYLQILVEWGPVFALPLFAWIAVVLVRASRDSDATGSIVRNVVLVLLFGSISLSLNNARMLWFFLGVLAVVSARARAQASEGNGDQPDDELGSRDSGRERVLGK